MLTTVRSQFFSPVLSHLTLQSISRFWTAGRVEFSFCPVTRCLSSTTCTASGLLAKYRRKSNKHSVSGYFSVNITSLTELTQTITISTRQICWVTDMLIYNPHIQGQFWAPNPATISLESPSLKGQQNSSLSPINTR